MHPTVKIYDQYRSDVNELSSFFQAHTVLISLDGRLTMDITKSLGLLIPFILWYINALKLNATHYCPVFCQNTTTSPWLYGALIVFLKPTGCIQGTGFSLYHYGACSLYNCLCELHPCVLFMGNYTKGTLSF